MSTTPLLVYKVLTATEVEALEAGSFSGSAADARDGFIHLSTAEQLKQSIERHFAGQNDLWLAAVDVGAAGKALRWEESRGGATFPHLYGRLTLEEVVSYGRLEHDADGAIKLPVAG